MARISDTALIDFPIASGIGALTLTGFTNEGSYLAATGTSTLSVTAAYNLDTCMENALIEWEFNLPTAGEIHISRDSAGNPTGTLISLSSDNNLRIYEWQTTRTLVATIPITGITIANGGEYIFRWRKTGYSHEFTLERVGVGTFSTSYSWPTSTMPGNAYGKPCIGVITGTIEVTDFRFFNNNLNAEWVIMGDSISDGNAYGSAYAARWPKQLKNRLGEGSVFVSARGGETILTIGSRFDAELALLRNPKYVVLALGTNTNSIATFTTQLNLRIAAIEAVGAIPILTTVVRTAQQSNVDPINALVRSSGRPFVEFANALTTDGTNSAFKPGYVEADGIHYTTAGYNAAFEQFISDVTSYGFL